MASEQLDPNPNTWERSLEQMSIALQKALRAMDCRDVETARRWFRRAKAVKPGGEGQRVDVLTEALIQVFEDLADLDTVGATQDEMATPHDYDLSTLTIEENPTPGEEK